MNFIFCILLLVFTTSARAFEIKLLDRPLPNEPYFYIDANFRADIKTNMIHVDIGLLRYRESPAYSIPLWSHYELNVSELRFSNGQAILFDGSDQIVCGKLQDDIFLGKQVWELTGHCVFVEKRISGEHGERLQIFLSDNPVQ